MVDLNLWQLRDPVADAVLLEFGTHETGLPFTRQPTIGAAEVETVRLAHPSGDGARGGLDRLRGAAWEFAGASFDKAALDPDRRWTRTLDGNRRFAGPWLDPRWRVAGAFAELRNVDRGVSVFGRPGNLVPDLVLARRGWATWAGQFEAFDWRYYGPQQTAGVAATQSPPPPPVEDPHNGWVPTPSGGGWVPNGGGGKWAFPSASTPAPSGGSSGSGITTAIYNAGAAPTPAVVEIVGSCSDPIVSLTRPNGTILWSVRFTGAVAGGQTARVSALPWSPEITKAGASWGGSYLGDPVARLLVPPGQSQLRYQATNYGGASRAYLRWRDAHAAL